VLKDLRKVPWKSLKNQWEYGKDGKISRKVHDLRKVPWKSLKVTKSQTAKTNM